MNDLNWLLVLVAFLAGVVFTLLWSLRAVTRKVAAKSAHPAPDTGVPEADVPEADQDPASTLEDVALVAVGIEAPTEAPTESSTDSTPTVDDAETVSWWDQAFVANRPEPAMSPTEQEPGTERSYGGTANRDLLGPAGERIKGNRDSMLYHTIASPYYGRTIAEAWFATEADAEAAGFTRWDRRKSTARLAPAAADPAPVAAPKVRNGKPARNGKAARGTIKGNRGSMLYHTVESPYYGRTKAEEWFASETEASAAGYRRWDHKRAQRG